MCTSVRAEAGIWAGRLGSWEKRGEGGRLGAVVQRTVLSRNNEEVSSEHIKFGWSVWYPR